MRAFAKVSSYASFIVAVLIKSQCDGIFVGAEVMSVLQLHGPTSAKVCNATIGAVVSLAGEVVAMARLTELGFCEGDRS